MTDPDDDSWDDPEDAVPGQDLAPETNVRVVGGQVGWTPAEPSPPTIPVLTADALVRAVTERAEPIGTAASEPEVLHASTTVAAAGSLDAPVSVDVLPAPDEGRIVSVGSKAERWAPALSAGFGSIMILVGLLLGAAAAYYYGSSAPCAAYLKAHGSNGFGCTAGVRKTAVLGPMVGFPVVVVGWLAWMWIPERSGRTRVRMSLGLLGVLVVLSALALLGITSAVH